LSHHYPQVLARSCAICTPMFLQEHIAGLSTGFRWDVRPRERRGIGARESPRRARCSYRNISQDYWPGMSQTSPDGLEGSEFVPEEVSRSEECSWRNISSDFVSEIRHSSSSSLKKCSCRNIVENLQLAKSGLKAKQRSLPTFGALSGFFCLQGPSTHPVDRVSAPHFTILVQTFGQIR
jgi:hypothetical protein